MARGLAMWTHEGTDYLMNDANIADEFDASESYEAGACVYHDGILKRFTESHSGAWTGTDVVTVKVADELTAAKSAAGAAAASTYGAAVSNLPNMVDDSVTWTLGKFIGANGEITVYGDMMYSSAIPVQNINRYVLTFVVEETRMNTRVHGYSGNSDDESVMQTEWVRLLGTRRGADTFIGGTYEIEFDVTDCDYIRISTCDKYHPYLCQTVDDKIEISEQQTISDLFSMSARKNLLDGVTWTNHKMINASGTEISTNKFMKYSALIPVASNRTYVLGFCIKAGLAPREVSVSGYNASGTFVKRIGYYPKDNQTAGKAEEFAFNPQGCEQIRINIGTGYSCCLSVLEEIAEGCADGLMYRGTCAFEDGTISMNNGKNYTTSSENMRIRTPGFADLSAEFIMSANLEIALFAYDRNSKDVFDDDWSGTFLGVWNGSKLVTGETAFFQIINVRKIYEQYKSTYPNFLFRIVAKRPDGAAGTVFPADGVNVKFYTRAEVSLYATLGVYSRWAVCGASYDSGNTPNGDQPYAGHNMYVRSWPQILARRSGNTCTNYTKSGYTLSTFITDDTEVGGQKRGLQQALRDDPQELYVITLGGNNAGITMGTIADIHDNDWTQNPDTFYGLYGQIVQRLKDHCMSNGYCTARFILTTPSSATGPWYSASQKNADNAIRAIGAHYGFPVVEWESDEFMRSELFLKHLLGTSSPHPSHIQYSGMALAFERLFARAVIANPAYFNYLDD